MSERFFANEPITGERAVLTGTEAQHLARVMRAKVGDELTLFDGSGAEFTARVMAIGKATVDLSIVARREISRELAFSMTLAVALPKGDRQKWFVEKATELGVTRLVPLVTERGVAQPVEAAVERLRRSVVEASKQCGRNKLLELAPPAEAIEFLATTPATATRVLADPSGERITAGTTLDQQSLIFAVGPEGGFTATELAAARGSGWRIVSLGERVLRVETAAISLAAWAAIGNSSVFRR
jgi:16S rRNA (uracil1498-N3)-methyltransferase